MNSKQRRKDRRTWIYEIESGSTDYSEYIEKFDWCGKMFGLTVSDGWRTKNGSFGDVWQFNSEDKATLFALRWANSKKSVDEWYS